MNDEMHLPYGEEQAMLAERQYRDHLDKIASRMLEAEIDWRGMEIELELRELGAENE